MISWLFPPASERRLLPDNRGRPMPYVIAIMMFVTLVVAAAGLAIANSAAVVRKGVASRYSVQIPDGAAMAARAEALVKAAPGVTAAQRVPEADVRRTLEGWLGNEASALGLPLPVLIDVEIAAGADVGIVEQRLSAAVPTARLTSYGERLAPLSRSLTALQWLALGLVVLMGVATAASVVLAARGALDTNRASIEVMHGIGATDEQIARLFQRRIAIDTFVGGVGGAVAGALVLLLVSALSGGVMGELAGGAILGWSDVLLLALLPVAFAALAMAVARVTVLRALGAAL